MSSSDIPAGDAQDNEYVSRTGQKDAVPVQSDDAPVEDNIDAETADSDAQLAKDDTDAIDESNIIEDKTRGASKKEGSYAEPGDEEGLSESDGTSSGAQ